MQWLGFTLGRFDFYIERQKNKKQNNQPRFDCCASDGTVELWLNRIFISISLRQASI